MCERINVMIIPTNFCNMNCLYCFHNAHNQNTDKMSFDILKKIMSLIIPSYKQVTFIWHGGEPLSMGIDFYKQAVYYENKFNQTNTQISNLMQTNLTLLTDEFADFLIKNNFKIGSSFDGINNDITRGHSSKILKGRDILRNHNSNCGFIQVVSCC